MNNYFSIKMSNKPFAALFSRQVLPARIAPAALEVAVLANPCASVARAALAGLVVSLQWPLVAPLSCGAVFPVIVAVALAALTARRLIARMVGPRHQKVDFAVAECLAMPRFCIAYKDEYHECAYCRRYSRGNRN